ncbi:ZCHC7 protein, partial [Upupa epops]|nr:ZCHC7 protein [Upupa epops]
MFAGYEDVDDTEAYEDELYHEESSSEQSIDSEVEFHLYSQIHYSQNLREVSSLETDAQADAAGVVVCGPVLTEEQCEDQRISECADRGLPVSNDPEVIVLSDTPDEDSIYKSKSKKSKSSSAQGRIHAHPVSSTPNRPDAAECNSLCRGSGTDLSRRRKSTAEKVSLVSHAGACAVQDVLVIDDSSEKDSCVSEGDHLESWMLLGASEDDGDEDIMLNLEGGASAVSKEEVDVDWSISDKDLEAQISNYTSVRHSSLRYYTADKNVTCRNCGKTGHLSKNCPTPKKVPPCCLCARRGHLQSTCPARFCLNCCLPGHYFRECLERAYWNKHCSRCDMQGHYADACPEIWRQYHLTTKPGPIKAPSTHPRRTATVYCYNCAQRGHFGHECSEKRMHGSMFPASPFIYCYEDEHEVKRRAKRVKRKVAELQEAGLLPEQPAVLWQEEQHVGYSHKKKSKPWKEHQRRSRDSERHRRVAVSQAGKQREEKHRHRAELSGGAEQDFPRGCRRQVCKGSRARHRSIFQAFSGSKAAVPPEPLDGTRRKKKWKKQKDARSDSSDNLFLIKQRKKRS